VTSENFHQEHLSKFSLAASFDVEEMDHWFLTREVCVWTEREREKKRCMCVFVRVTERQRESKSERESC